MSAEFLYKNRRPAWAKKARVRESKSVKILRFKANAKSKSYLLLEEASENEPAITKDLENLALSNNAELVGLENRFKNENSLAQKLMHLSLIRNTSIEKEANRNNDTLRFTMVFLSQDFASGSASVFDESERNGLWRPADLECVGIRWQ